MREKTNFTRDDVSDMPADMRKRIIKMQAEGFTHQQIRDWLVGKVFEMEDNLES